MNNTTKITAVAASTLITTVREFSARRDKVFRAFTQKQLVQQWWTPAGVALVDQFDAHSGGKWHITHKPNAELTIRYFGYFHDVTAPERIVQTSDFDMVEPGHTVLSRYEFAELPDGRTRLTLTEAFLSVEDRDMALASGMEHGVINQHSALDRVLADMQ